MITKSQEALQLLQEAFLGLYPEHLVPDVQQALDQLRLPTMRLCLEVLDAEASGTSYQEAVRHFQRFPLMSRTHFAVRDLLRTELPDEILDMLRQVLTRAAEGEFEPWHEVLFSVGRRKSDPVAALFRFLLWQGIQLNLLVASWSTPACQALHVLDEAEEQSEVTLRALLDLPAMADDEVRPLHVLVAEALLRLDTSCREKWAQAVRDQGERFQELLVTIGAIERARQLSAKDAATIDPGGAFGDQQIVDLYPQHFTSVPALRTARSRLRYRAKPRLAKTRFIDLLQEVGG